MMRPTPRRRKGSEMPRFKRHLFICVNERPPGHPKGCCREKGSEELAAAFKSALAQRGLNREIRANKSGCLDACAFGPSVVVYPEGIWYGRVTREDVEEIVERHLVGGEPVERLRIYKEE